MVNTNVSGSFSALPESSHDSYGQVSKEQEQANMLQENDVVCRDKASPAQHYSWQNVMICVAICLFLSSTIINLYVATSIREIQFQKPLKPEQKPFSQVCIQCVRLVHDQFSRDREDPLIEKLHQRLDDGIHMCCAQNEEQMSVLVEAILGEQVAKPVPRVNSADSSMTFPTVSAHKQLLPSSNHESNQTEPYYGNANGHHLVRFNQDLHDPLTEHAQGVTVLDTSLQIQLSGVYYVYLSVNMAPQSQHSIGSLPGWNHFVHRTRPSSPADSTALLQVAHSPCTDCSQHQETAFAGGTFRLKENDQIEVCIAGHDLVQYKKESSFLGLVLLSSDASGNM